MKKYHRHLPGSDLNDTFPEVFEFTRDDIFVTYPHDYEKSIRILEVETGAAADVKLPYMQCWPSKRICFMGKTMWLAGSLKPISVIYPDTDHDVETFTAVFNTDRIDFSCILGCFAIDCRVDHNKVPSVKLRRTDEPKLKIAADLSKLYPHEEHMNYITKKGGYRLLSTAIPRLIFTVIRAITELRPPHPGNDLVIASRKAQNLPPLAKDDLPYGYDRLLNSTHDFICSISDALKASDYDLVVSRIYKLFRGRYYDEPARVTRVLSDVLSGKINWRS